MLRRRTRARGLASWPRVGLALATVASTAPIGQRTTILLPFLVIVFFRLKLSLPRLVLTAMVGVLCAALLLSVFKWQYSTTEAGVAERIAQTVADDFSRDGVLATALGATDLIGTRMLSYPMSGYVYCALFFVPRSLAPFKGYPTAQYFTSYVVGTSVETTDWGFGVGAIEEILLNGGLLLFVPIMLIYGFSHGPVRPALTPGPFADRPDEARGRLALRLSPFRADVAFRHHVSRGPGSAFRCS